MRGGERACWAIISYLARRVVAQEHERVRVLGDANGI